MADLTDDALDDVLLAQGKRLDRLAVENRRLRSENDRLRSRLRQVTAAAKRKEK
jgi:regulator of replication initiation timing